MMNLVELKCRKSTHGEAHVINALEIDVISRETLRTSDAEKMRSLRELKLDIADDTKKKGSIRKNKCTHRCRLLLGDGTGMTTKLCNKVAAIKTVFGSTVQGPQGPSRAEG